MPEDPAPYMSDEFLPLEFTIILYAKERVHNCEIRFCCRHIGQSIGGAKRVKAMLI
jgi:hypothetical protein